MRFPRIVASSLLMGLLASLGAAASISNWPAPATWTPPTAHGIRTLSESPPVPFVPVTPCRVADTRGNGFTGQYGPPALIANANRNFTITGVCGIPAGAEAVSFNFAALNVGGAGDLRVFPAGATLPLVSTMNYNAATPNIANAAVVPLGTGGAITVRADAVAVDLVIDVNGYYSSVLNSSNFFELETNSTGYTMYLKNHSTTCSGACGLRQETDSNTANWAIAGIALGTAGANVGVLGETVSNTDNTKGVWGMADTGTAVAYGVHGQISSTNQYAAGVLGTTSQGSSSAGIFVNSGLPLPPPDNQVSAALAFQSAGVNYGVWTNSRIAGTSLIIAGAPKNFVSPHPLDPSREIAYASVEAPTVDVYFRGTGMLENGYAYIEVPDHFRFTAREGTYMTTLTAVGRPLTLSVESEGPDGIVVRGSGNAKFHYVVYAERAEIEGYQPVRPNATFVPDLMERVHLLTALPRTTRALLVKNGTLNEDGTYNEATARAMGWVIPEPVSYAQSQK